FRAEPRRGATAAQSKNPTVTAPRTAVGNLHHPSQYPGRNIEPKTIPNKPTKTPTIAPSKTQRDASHHSRLLGEAGLGCGAIGGAGRPTPSGCCKCARFWPSSSATSFAV